MSFINILTSKPLQAFLILNLISMFVLDFQTVQDLPQQERDFTYYLQQINRSQIRTGSSKGVKNRGVADMSWSGESLRFVDQQNLQTLYDLFR